MIYESGITFGELTTFTSRVVSDSGIGHLIIRGLECNEGVKLGQEIDLKRLNEKVFTLDFMTIESLDSVISDLTAIRSLMDHQEKEMNNLMRGYDA